MRSATGSHHSALAAVFAATNSVVVHGCHHGNAEGALPGTEDNMPVQRTRRLTLRVFESTRRIASRHTLVQQSVGFSAEIVLLGAFAVMGWLEQQAKANDPPVDEAVSFLAPLRPAAPPPAEERLSFVGLGNASVSSVGETDLPRDDGRQPVALSQSGTKLISELGEPQPESDSPRAMTEIEVDSTAALDPTAEGPAYPQDLMDAGVQGVVYAQFVVDSTGYADTLTLQVLEQVQQQFVASVKQALPRMKYKPAVFAGKRVNQLVQQAFVFRIQAAARDTMTSRGG